jgi:hypothetical protein
MPLELWIVLAIAAAGFVLGLAARMRRARGGAANKAEKNVYTLW